MKRIYNKPEISVFIVHTRYAMMDSFSVSKEGGKQETPPEDNDWGVKQNNVWQWDDEDEGW